MMTTNIYLPQGVVAVVGACLPETHPEGYEKIAAMADEVYTLCLEEMYGKEFAASVEYLGSGTVRKVVFSPADRRVFLEALKTAERVHQGEIPRAVRGAYCRQCRFFESCRPLEKPVSLFDRMRGKR